VPLIGGVEFAAVLAVLYVLECVIELHPHDLVFTQSGRRYRARRPWLYPSNGDWGWLILNPFRPAAIRLRTSVRAASQELLDTRSLSRRVATFRAATRSLRLTISLHATVLLVLCPMAVAVLGLRAILIPAALLSFLLAALTASLFHRAWKQFGPPQTPWPQLVKMTIYPIASLRALDQLALPLLNDWHPLALAVHFNHQAAAARLYRSAWAAAHFGPNPAPAGVESLTQLLQDSGLDPTPLIRPPTPWDPTCVTYCPNCQAQFVLRAGTCTDCSGITLCPFTTARTLAAHPSHG